MQIADGNITLSTSAQAQDFDLSFGYLGSFNKNTKPS